MNQSRSSNNEGLFTFKPKLSLTSTRIVENMGTDFMARQQNHLEKQKKMLEKVEHPRNGQLSPMGKTRKSNKDGAKDGSDADQDVHNDSKSKIHETSSDEQLTKPTKEKISASLQRILDGPYASGHPDIALKKLRPPGTSQRPRYPHSRPHSDGDDSDDDRKDNQPTSQSCVEPGMLGNMRSKTMPPQQSLNRPKLGGRRSSYMTGDRLRVAKDMVDKAIRLRKVFTIQGGYSAVRNSLRRRGWIEKFYRLSVPAKKPPGHKRKRNSEEDEDDDADDDDDGDCTDDDDGHKPEEPKIPPWEEEEGIYGIMSRMVRNVNPSFYWVLKRDAIDYRFLGREQMVNHYCKAGSFTTKVGLCVNMRNVPWYEQANPDVFFPRCYRLSHNEDKEAFIDDYRLTSCINIIKLILKQAKDGPESEKEEETTPTVSEENGAPQKCDNPECAKLSQDGGTDTVCEHRKAVEDAPLTPKSSKAKTEEKKKKKKPVIVPLKALENSISECEQFLRSKNHDDIDDRDSNKELSPHNWNLLIQWFYMLAHEGGLIPNVPSEMISQCESLINRLKTHCPQLEMDGAKNVWIVKPGAKSRGRGIVCYAKLEEMLKLVDSHVMKKEGKFVVQKYIERPLLIYNTKFDIRQWFLVTDWNPLTLWFYQDCYLRFCSQEYTLDKFDESIHLSNNAIQKNYKNGPRSNMLPQENMWSHYEFKEFLSKRRQGHKWEELIYPGMKKAIICALLATQDLVEYRKFSFELYGADFMLTEDYKPWLIEINCSPSMEASTAVTAELCANVLEDTVKVVVDRRFDKNADSGRFELAYKQSPVTVPPYIGLNLSVDGQGIKPPPPVKSTESSCSRLHESASQEERVDTDKVGKASEKDEAKSDEEGGETSDMSEQKTSNPPSKSSSATRDMTKRKSQSSPLKTASKMSQESVQSAQKSAGTTKSEATWKKERSVSQSVISQTNGVSKSMASPTSMYAITGSRRIVSRTSVANNYPVVNTNQGQKEQQTLQVNTVDSKTLQSQSSTSAPNKGNSSHGTHAGMCGKCGGVILKHDMQGLIIATPVNEDEENCCEYNNQTVVKRLKTERQNEKEKGTVLVLPTAQISHPYRLGQVQVPPQVVPRMEKPEYFFPPPKSLQDQNSIQKQLSLILPCPPSDQQPPTCSRAVSARNPGTGRLVERGSAYSISSWTHSSRIFRRLSQTQLAPSCIPLKVSGYTEPSPTKTKNDSCNKSKNYSKSQFSPPPYRPPSPKHPGEKPWASLVTSGNNNGEFALCCSESKFQTPVTYSTTIDRAKSVPKFRKSLGTNLSKHFDFESQKRPANIATLSGALCIVPPSPTSKP